MGGGSSNLHATPSMQPRSDDGSQIWTTRSVANNDKLYNYERNKVLCAWGYLNDGQIVYMDGSPDSCGDQDSVFWYDPVTGRISIQADGKQTRCLRREGDYTNARLQPRACDITDPLQRFELVSRND